MTFRSRALLDLAHGMPCQVRFKHACTGYRGCEPMHADWQEWGRGHGHKSPDWAWAAGCSNAHRELGKNLGEGGMAPEQRKAEWLAAYVRTQNFLWENGMLRIGRKRPTGTP